jgi:septum formation protein
MQSLATRTLILASTSRYRRTLLERLQLPFSVQAPGVDETSLAGEPPAALARRLALAKAAAVADATPHSVVIGCDQVADLHGQALGKPGNYENALSQLRAMRGQTVVFQTAMAVVCRESGFCEEVLVPVRVAYRDASDAEIDFYLRAEEPYDCAGSVKSEGMGIALMHSIDNDDPTALIGLPLIRLSALLRQAGIPVLGSA